MPDLNDPLHLNMFAEYKKKREIPGELESEVPEIYGFEWGNPDTNPMLMPTKKHFILPYVVSNHRAVEIGPGGGRWTKYLIGFRKLYCVDYHNAILDELKRNYNKHNMVFIKNNGADFPGIDDNSIDYLFTFGTFVHLDIDIIQEYLYNMKRILKSGCNAIIQYSDKTKEDAIKNKGFSENRPDIMRRVVQNEGYLILEEDLETLCHSSLIRFTKNGNT